MRRLSHHTLDPSETRSFVLRYSLLVSLLIILSLLLVLRLAYLQFAQYKLFATLSLKNQMSILPLPPSRGIICDKNGVVLAENIPVYSLEIIPERIPSLPSMLKKLQELLPSLTKQDIQGFYRARRRNPGYVPIPFKLKLSEEEVATFAANQYQFPGVSIKAVLMRHYPLGEITAHLLGFVGRINQQELQQVDTSNYRATNFMGKAGIEKFYEHLLHGSIGYQQIETDVSGRTLRVLSKQNPIAGHKLYLTIDSRLQRAGYQALQDKRGALVLMSAKHGDILAMVSAPSFDPNLFVNGISHQDYQRLSDEEDRPLYNRAVRGLYPPASTIKPFIALGALDKGFTSVHHFIIDKGWYQLPGVQHQYRDWKHTGHGIVTLQRAITVSCDTYFYQLGNKMGIGNIENILVKFGFGQLSGIDLLEEAAGLVPNPHWKRHSKQLPWYPGDTLITAIGQGFTLTTPLQLANATASLSQYGHRFRPHLLKNDILDNYHIAPYKVSEEYPIQLKSQAYWDTIHTAMQSVIHDPEGTAAQRFGRNAPYTAAGKTGTAQVFSLSQDNHKQYINIPVALRDHSVFIAFAPVIEPEVAIAVVVEHDKTAPLVARQVLDAYFELKTLGQLDKKATT